jgi:hypothetical protein
MFDTPPDARLELHHLDRGLTISAWVAAAPPRPLRWRLELSSRSGGGTSTVSQSGLAAAGDGPVGSVAVSPGSRGTATLKVYDGDREVASDELSFDDGPAGR